MTTQPAALVQRLFAGAWLLTCIVFAVIGWDYQAEFSYEPVGPRAYPLLCLGLMAIGLAWLIVRPPALKHEEDDAPMDAALLRKAMLCIALLLAYAGLFEPLGFIPSSALVGSFIALLYGGRPLPAVTTCTLLSAGLYLLFDCLLEVPLPLGVLERLPF
ncbi:tripartite tricarboxylate transporter TctB family protein [Lysobacter sp. S4-A87]|uniref:tripartite tricarboxylate transporter TctB family protein n=1 Tax=Lysobacter sp. S4-A87 TaxID=2925843 RepID=UPI001F5392B8|nr:tripartite tricarboxylate transporter TctB family protein [Lysobacter sp. S4-A87]UNK48025.1 tripartite tricarboxylate transporter TctB family protein [Lysobacter sp. S4-A87]